MIIFKKTITYLSLVAVIVLPIFFLTPQQASADECGIINHAYFEPVTVSAPVIKNGIFSFNYAASTSPSIKVIAETQGCVGQRIRIQVLEGTSLPTILDAFKDQEYVVPTSGKVEVTVKPSENDCTKISSGLLGSYDCQYKVVIVRNGSPLYDSSTYATTGANKGYVLNYNCNGLTCLDGLWKITANNALRVSETCKINYKTAFYSNLGPTPLHLRSADNPGLELAVFVDTGGCVGWTGKVTLEEVDYVYNDDLTDSFPFVFDINGGPTRIPFVAGENRCSGSTPNCSFIATITPYDNDDAGDEYTTEKLPLHYNCLVPGECTKGSTYETSWHVDENPSNLATPLTSKTAVGILSSGADCEVISTQFDPYTSKTGLADYELIKLDTHGWFREDYRDVINQIVLTIKTKKCAGTPIFVDVVGKDLQSASLLNKELPITTLNKRAFVVPTGESFTIKLVAGEENCMSWGGNIVGTDITGADCKFNIQTSTLNTVGDIKKIHDSANETYGNLNFECNTNCDQDLLWKFAGDTSAKPYPSDPLGGEDPVTLADDGSGSISPDCLGADGKAIEGCYQLYGGFGKMLTDRFGNVDTIGDFINAIIALAIGIAGVITVGMIMWDGFTYWKADGAGDTAGVLRVKGVIWKRLLGLLLLFTIYTLLRTINPDLLNLTPRIDPVGLSLAAQSQLSGVDYTAITGEPLKSPSEYDALAKQVATKFSSDYCALRVIIQNESRGNPNVVGQDENVRDPGIPSRVAFINSGKKYSGTTFATSEELIKQKGFCNDAAGCAGNVPKPNSTTLGLDWRFTKGIGLTQITFYPSDYKDFKTAGYVPLYTNKDNPPSRTFNFSSGKITVTPYEMFKPEKNLEIAAKLWNEGMKTCNNDPKGAFYTYVCGNCSCENNAFAATAVNTRTSQYAQCKKENP